MLITYEMPEFTTAKPYTPEYTTLFSQWCKDHNAYYYARPSSDFNKYEAISLALQDRATILLLENMS